MVFNSIEFAIFLPIVVLLFYLLPQKLRWVMLLAASCVFYMWFVPHPAGHHHHRLFGGHLDGEA